ncbi:RNA-directed DNA polymerase, eukaryota [Tanacetum coccineum]
MHNNDLLYDNNHNNIMPDKDKVLSKDPFNLYDILNKRKDSGDDLKYPFGFTPSVINMKEVNKEVKGATSNKVNEHVNTTSNKLEEFVPKGKLSSNNSVCSKRVHTDGLILQLMDELVKVGQTMGYNMEGCMRNIEVIIGLQGECNVETKLKSMELVTIKTLWGGSNEEILSDRSLLLKELNDINYIDSLEVAQKSKLFVRPLLMASGLLILGYEKLSLEQQADLERNVSNEEIKSVIWDCGNPLVLTAPLLSSFIDIGSLFSSIPIDSSLTLSHIFFTDDDIFIVKVGGVMSRIKYWDGVVAKVSSRLSKWKFKTLSTDIIREVTVLRIKGINLLDLIRKKVGNRLNTLFWEDLWLDDLALNHKFPRLYAFDNYKQITVVEKINHASMVDTFRRPPKGGAEEEQLGFLLSRMDGLILTNIPDRWVWSLEATSEFSVKSVCRLTDDSILPKEEVATKWVKVMPIKINVFAWRVHLDKLPTQLNLSLKGIDISTIVCPIFHASIESGSPIFFSCPMARHLWRKLLRWNQLLFGATNPRRELLFDDLGSFNLNNTTEDEDDEVQEVRPSHPIGRDQTKKKGKAGTPSVSSTAGFDVESLAKLMVNDPYNIQKGENMTELLQMKKMEMEFKAKELEIRQLDQRQKNETLYLSSTDEKLKEVVRARWNLTF